MLNGFLNVFKDKSKSSFEVVDSIKKMFKDELGADIKIGHLGTLDPCAVGVLPIALGKATRLCEFIENKDKKYLFELTLGFKTTTGDQEGDVLDVQTIPHISDERIISVCSDLIGCYFQKVPSYSASKVEGKRFYELARANQKVPERYKEVNIKQLKFIKRNKNSLWFEVLCSFGTYIRTLCEDIAVKLGTIGTMTFLLRETSGDFHLKDSISLEKLRNLIMRREYFKVIIPVNKMLSHIPVVVLNYENAKKFVAGQEVWIKKDFDNFEILRIFCMSGTFLGLAEKSKGEKKIWKPNKVIII
ncbi:tRNA pseudouridine synthase B [Thermodesulfobium acidiphilum]|uniref:tRNA pseudouridine synthase B n=1 Tax=Thermodesulfobium acidiphilum TaxID=1794699 RepID=A0A2R4VZG9_THEAF|nr:tRNA pseudouridine(55) synthase TruB [Thermodesulfobium acidiphilum]AWB09953.1 tRNA pseudouridine synthase B [Thermodesulfobium acidiphilum]